MSEKKHPQGRTSRNLGRKVKSTHRYSTSARLSLSPPFLSKCASESLRLFIGFHLERLHQPVWHTPTRVSGLIALVAHIGKSIKNRKKKDDKPGVPCSNRVARGYVSKLRTAPEGTIREPLPLLVHIGALERVAPAQVSFHLKKSARYRLAPALRTMALNATDDETTPCIRRKLENAHERRERGLNRGFPFRETLLRDLARVSLPSSADDVKARLLGNQDTRPSALRSINAIATQEHTVKVMGSGLIVTSLISCPRDLKSLWHLDGEAVTLCDISSAHWMFLPRIVKNRLDYCRARGDPEETLKPMADEFSRLVDLCSSGTFYAQMCREGATPEDIKRTKGIANMLLNQPQSKASKNVIWRGLHRRFPHCFGIIADIKKRDHREISKQLQSFTARAIAAALIDMQGKGLPAIPDSDCLIVRDRDKAAACLAIGRAMFTETRGVFATVGGVRYSHPCNADTCHR